MKAAAYPEHWLETVRFHRRFAEHDLNDWLCEQLAPQPHHTFLDIGCGTGEQLLHFASVCRRCIGVDNAELPLRRLAAIVQDQNIRNVEWLCCPGECISLDDSTVDLVACNFALPYMNARQVLSEIRRLLTNGGRSIITGYAIDNVAEMIAIHRDRCPYVVPGYINGFCDAARFADVAEHIFSRVEQRTWTNPMRFPRVADFMQYYTHTDLYMGAKDMMEDLEEAVTTTAQAVLSRDGEIRITKVISALYLANE